MISIVIGTAMKRNQYLVDSNSTIEDLRRQYLHDAPGRLFFNQTPVDDFDATLAELGATEEGNTLIAVVEKNAGATIRVDGPTMKVISTLTPEGVKRLQKYMPDSLVHKVTEGDMEIEKLKIGLSSGEGEMNARSISFNAQPTNSGKCWVTVTLPEVEDKKDYIADEYGELLAFLNFVEMGAANILQDIQTKLDSVAATIQIVED